MRQRVSVRVGLLVNAPIHEFEKTCNELGIKHTTTTMKHAWTAAYGERFKKTLLDGFCPVSFRKKRQEHSEKLQTDLNNVMDSYNYEEHCKNANQ